LRGDLPAEIHSLSSAARKRSGSFGERLESTRLARSITLQEIAESTKISTRMLRALETEDFDKLPGGVFNRGFVRAYATYLGLDPEETVTDFIAAESERGAGSGQFMPIMAEKTEREPLDLVPVVRLAVIVVLLGGAVLALIKFSPAIRNGWQKIAAHGKSVPPPMARTTPTPAAQKPGTPPEQQPDPTSASSAASASTPAAAPAPPAQITADPAAETKRKAPPTQPAIAPADSSAPIEPQPSVGNAKLNLRVRAYQDSWLSVEADGRNIADVILVAGQERSFHAEQKLVFRTGNAGGVELTLNGKLLPPLGEEKQVKSRTFTVEGVQQ
jgi:cytoskeleton protein RodZ